MNNRVIDCNTVEEFDALSEKDKLVCYVTFIRLHLDNRGENCGAKAILLELEEANINPLPSLSTINRILRQQYLANSRTGYYPEDYC